MTRPATLPVSGPGRILIGAVSGVGALALLWPFLVASSGPKDGAAPIVLMVLTAMVIGLCAVELTKGTMDARGIAVLGILAACGTALRIPSPGVAGIEPVFFLLILAGRVFGPGFGFALGGVTMLTSALVTGGVGPWLPFQMLAAGWVGMGSGMLPRMEERREIAVLATYGAAACIAYGTVMNLWFWPTVTGSSTGLSYVPGASALENLGHFIAFDLATSLGFDLPRAVINAGLILLLGRPILRALRRAAVRTRLVDPPATAEVLDPI
jgi:energy-coupling factor transport system substrate-specific component